MAPVRTVTGSYKWSRVQPLHVIRVLTDNEPSWLLGNPPELNPYTHSLYAVLGSPPVHRRRERKKKWSEVTRLLMVCGTIKQAPGKERGEEVT